MELLVFRRTDSALVVVPAMFQPPLACRRDGLLVFSAVCDIEVDDFTDDVVAALARDGFAVVRGPDWDLLAHAVDTAADTRVPTDPMAAANDAHAREDTCS